MDKDSLLPLELEREIFEIALAQDPKCRPRIVLVSRRAREWFEADLYRIICFGEHHLQYPPIYVPTSTSPTVLTQEDKVVPRLDYLRISRFGPHVRHMLFHQRPPDEIGEILKRCPNVGNLRITNKIGENALNFNLIPILERLESLRRLSINPIAFFDLPSWEEEPVPFNQKCFSRITHFGIDSGCLGLWNWNELASMPRLTHLSFRGGIENHQGIMDEVLKKCPNLEVCVLFRSRVLLNMGLGGHLRYPQKDPRGVFLATEDFEDNWEKFARGEKDYWAVAEREKRKAVEELQLKSEERS